MWTQEFLDYLIMPRADVKFIPWDPTSTQHVEKLILQREACGWNAPNVKTQWRDAHLDGSKCLYWIVSSVNGRQPAST